MKASIFSTILLIALAVGLAACVENEGPVMMSATQVQTEIARIRLASANITRSWLARHRSHIYRMALIEGAGAFNEYDYIDLNAGVFTSYILGHDMDITDFEVARNTARFLANLWFYENGAEGMMNKRLVRGRDRTWDRRRNG
jgi:hypothetical protein